MPFPLAPPEAIFPIPPPGGPLVRPPKRLESRACSFRKTLVKVGRPLLVISTTPRILTPVPSGLIPRHSEILHVTRER